MAESYFSISFDLIATGHPLPYDLFINSSSLQSREKFVKIVRAGDSVTREDITKYHQKYHQLYVREGQRSDFLKSLVLLDVTDPTMAQERPVVGVDGSPPRVTPIEVKKTAILKDSAIHHLENLFQKEPTTEVLNQSITACRDVVENMIDVLHKYDIDKLRELIANLSFHDFYTFDHSVNVSMYCILIYQTLHPDASRADIMQAGLAGLLHDLGKIMIPTEIINNAGKLSDEEFAVIKTHPDHGRKLLLQTDLNLPADMDPGEIGQIVCEHHENWDGTGYPRKIAGNTIHEMARITAIADFFDAITTKRSYSEPLTLENAIALMGKFVGKKLDPKLFQFFVDNTEKFTRKPASRLELTETDFDPCQPHETLPLAVIPSATGSGELHKAAAQVKVVAPPAGNEIGKVKVIDDASPAKQDFGKVKVLGGEAAENLTSKPIRKKP